jgi:hypothetical protein
VARESPSRFKGSKETEMEDISRRRFLRGASIGAVTLGAAATVGQGALDKLVKPSARAAGTAAMTVGAGGREPANANSEVMAHVVGGPSGAIEIYSGTDVVTLHNLGMANALLGALRS